MFEFVSVNIATFKKHSPSDINRRNCGNSNYNGNLNINNNSNTNYNENSNTKENSNIKNNGNINNSNTNYNENSNTNENSNIKNYSNDILEEEYIMEKSKVEEHIERLTKGKSYAEITSQTIPIHNWIDKYFPSNSHRLKKFAIIILDKIKMEGFASKPSTTPIIDEYQAGLIR